VTKRYKSEALRAAHETATGLHRLGLIDAKTMRDLDVSCLTSRKALGKGYRGSVAKEKTT
jgi:putative transcriptional regulator